MAASLVFSSTLEIPKSPSFTVPLPVKNMLEVLMSLWMTLRPWIYSSAIAIWMNQFNISSSVKFSFLALFLFNVIGEIANFSVLHDDDELAFLDEARLVADNMSVV